MRHVVDLDLQPHAISGLVPCAAEAVRSGLALEPAYWTVLDDGAIERCIALVGRDATGGEPSADWRSTCLDASAKTSRGKSSGRRTHGGRAIASHQGWVYVFGSSRGAIEGSRPKACGFAARFREEHVRVDEDGALSAELQVAADPFVLHRLVNDALVHTGTPLFAFSPRYLERTLLKTRRKAIAKGRGWSWRIACDDVPIDIAGAAFTPEGHLLLGLRLPTTRHGEPIVVEVRHATRLFGNGGGEPVAGRVLVVGGAGSRRAPLGVRDLHVDVESGTLHALLGNPDPGRDENSLFLAEHPEGASAESLHVGMTLPAAPKTLRAKASRALTMLDATPLHRFEGLRHVEGVAADGARRFVHISDEDRRVRMRFLVVDDPAAPGASRAASAAEASVSRNSTGRARARSPRRTPA